ncbi:integrase arm-type DNA-binding domain-containing protein [Granulicella sp. 5B5]|uniref:tyrosine-type recombinase/integrase n=1 Tax=Granulicella sp. 5B5 TaxID=1617967 RepID=UPI001C70EBA1|nr:integrase arm-type DNA-binding domain-containing protein [Granulicella sp. 5B5]
MTDVLIRSAKPAAKKRRLHDTFGLYLEVLPTGTKSWRMKYRFRKKEKSLTLGKYPDMGLRDARDSVSDARKVLREGRDPGMERRVLTAARELSAADTFEAIGREWLAEQKPGWAHGHFKRQQSLLANDVFPHLGPRPIAEITAPEVLITVRRVKERALERAHRTLQVIGQIYRYAVATGRAKHNIVADLRGSLPSYKSGHFAAPTEPEEFAAHLRMMNNYKGTPAVKAALKLAPMLFARPGELRKARWADIQLDNAEWRYISSKTKKPHIVPLASQAVTILRDLHKLTGRGLNVFPGQRSVIRPMSDNAVLAAMRRMGIPADELTGHGLRATARTLIEEELHYRPEVIELQLAHEVKDSNGSAYNRTKHLTTRKKMMQEWADYLDKLAEYPA